jgi:hypothetical protein
MLYVPISIYTHTYVLGVFKTKHEAKKACVNYLMKHPNFDKWFNDAQNAYAMYYDNEKRITVEELQESLCDPFEDFWHSKMELGFTIEQVEKGSLFPFYQWNAWVMDEPGLSYGNTNLYKAMHCVFHGHSFEIDQDYYIENYPLI